LEYKYHLPIYRRQLPLQQQQLPCQLYNALILPIILRQKEVYNFQVQLVATTILPPAVIYLIIKSHHHHIFISANSSVVSSLNQSSERLTVAAAPQQVTPTQIITTPVKRLSQGGHEGEADEQDHEKENQSSPEQVNNRNTKIHSQSLFDSVAAKTPEAKRKNSNPTPPRIINSNNTTTTTLPSYSNNTTTTTPIPTKSTHYTPLHPSTPNNNSTTAGGRQSAVSLVGDLLNKIGVLENKLSSCRKFIRDSPWRETHQQHTSMRRSKSEKLPVQHPPRKIVFQNSLKRSEEKTTTTTTTTATTNSEVKD